MTGFNTQLSAECISLLNLVMALSSLNNICAIKSMIVLQVKCPQLSKPEATAARNENSIGDRMEKKPWEKPGSVGGPVPLRPDESVVCSNCSKVSVSGPLVPGVFPRWMSRWRGPHWRSVSGAHLGGPRRGCHRLFSGVRSSLSFKGRIQTCNHTSPRPAHPASSPPRSSETSHPDSCCNNRFA